MEPEIQSPAQEWERWAQEWERLQQSRKAALEKCWTACETGDIIQFNNQIQETLGELGDASMHTLLQRTIIRKGWLEGTRCLLEHEADPKVIPFVSLIRAGCSVAMLQLLADFGKDYKSEEDPVLAYAIGRREILDWLLDQGLDINRGGNIILKGADRVYRDNTVAVLNAAAVYGDIDLFDYLVARGAKASQSNALHHVGRSNNAAAMIPHLINTYHLDVNAHDSCGGLNELVKWDVTQHGSPLNYAVYYRNVPAAEVLLKYGANIGDACAIAIEKKSAPAVKLLLDAGADPSRGLGIAITQGFLEGAQLCLEYGGDIAIGEARDEYHAGFGGPYTGMSSEMRKLLDVWKDKRFQNAKA